MVTFDKRVRTRLNYCVALGLVVALTVSFLLWWAIVAGIRAAAYAFG